MIEDEIPAALKPLWQIAKGNGMSVDGFFEVIETATKVITAAEANPDGHFGVMRDMEKDIGAVVVPVGSTKPFPVPSVDWNQETLITVLGVKARIVVASANFPRSGALSRLVHNIKAAGLIPVIVSPVGPIMPAILKHWGWTRAKIGEGETVAEEWSE